MVQPAFIRFDDNRLGALGMIATQADLDCRYAMRDGKALAEFTFDGDDDGDPWLGRGWATLESDGTLHGRLFIHHGDDSDFVAERVTTKPRASGGGREAGHAKVALLSRVQAAGMPAIEANTRRQGRGSEREYSSFTDGSHRKASEKWWRRRESNYRERVENNFDVDDLHTFRVVVPLLPPVYAR